MQTNTKTVNNKQEIKPVKKIESKSLYEILLRINPKECENNVVVNPIDRWIAYSLLTVWKLLEAGYRRIYNIAFALKDANFYGFLDREEKEQLLLTYNSIYHRYLDYDAFQKDVEKFVEMCAKKYVWFRYFCSLSFVGLKSALAIIYMPPTIIHTARHREIKQNTWWNRLIPLHKYEERNGQRILKHTNKSLYAKMFYTDFLVKFLIDVKRASLKFVLNRISVYNNSERIKQYILEQIRRETRSVVGKEVDYDKLPREKQIHVLLRVCRNLLRVYLYNTYYIAWYYMYKHGVDRDKVVRPVYKPSLPEEVQKRPLALLEYIEPIEIVHKKVVDKIKMLIPDIEEIKHIYVLREILKIHI